MSNLRKRDALHTVESQTHNNVSNLFSRLPRVDGVHLISFTLYDEPEIPS